MSGKPTGPSTALYWQAGTVILITAAAIFGLGYFIARMITGA